MFPKPAVLKVGGCACQKKGKGKKKTSYKPSTIVNYKIDGLLKRRAPKKKVRRSARLASKK